MKKSKKNIAKKEAYYILHKLYKFIETNGDNILFKKLRGVCGWYDDNGDDVLIQIDYRKDMIPTLIHELLHHVHKDWHESKVCKHESLIVNATSVKQVRNLLKKIGNYI